MLPIGRSKAESKVEIVCLLYGHNMIKNTLVQKVK